jgi:hypothetical protein
MGGDCQLIPRVCAVGIRRVLDQNGVGPHKSCQGVDVPVRDVFTPKTFHPQNARGIQGSQNSGANLTHLRRQPDQKHGRMEVPG